MFLVKRRTGRYNKNNIHIDFSIVGLRMVSEVGLWSLEEIYIKN